MENILSPGLYYGSNSAGSNSYTYLMTNTTTTVSDPVTYFPPLPKPQLAEGVARPEDPFAWLRRRVEEISWQPEIA